MSNSLIALFSQARLSDYDSLAIHEANFALIHSFAHKVGIAEIIIRNKIDSILCANNPTWLESLQENPLDSIIIKPSKKRDRDSIISAQSLGFWLCVVESFKIHNRVFSEAFLDSIDFRKYYVKNKSTFKAKHNRLLRHHKATAILGLLRLIRNRAFHFENMFKMNEKGPRLSVRIHNKYGDSALISIHPSKITDFLNDIITSFDKDLLTYGENVDLNKYLEALKSGGKCRLENERILAQKSKTNLKQ